MLWVIGIFVSLLVISFFFYLIKETGVPTLAMIFDRPQESFLVLLFCGIGFALGNIFSFLWAIYGTILFGLIAWTLFVTEPSKEGYILGKLSSYALLNSGLGFVIGDVFALGWALFGAFMGALLALVIFKEKGG